MDAGDLAIIRVAARLTIAALCLTGMSAVIDSCGASAISMAKTDSHVKAQIPSVMYVTCQMLTLLGSVDAEGSKPRTDMRLFLSN